MADKQDFTETAHVFHPVSLLMYSTYLVLNILNYDMMIHTIVEVRFTIDNFEA